MAEESLEELEELLEWAYHNEINISIESYFDTGYNVSILTGFNNSVIESQETGLMANEVKQALSKLLIAKSKQIIKNKGVSK